jgi:protease-4
MPPEAPIFESTPAKSAGTPIVVQTGASLATVWFCRLLMLLLGLSVVFNLALYSAWGEYFAALEPPQETFISGSRTASERIVRITISGTIMPPFTERTLEQIQKAADDDNVKGVVLAVDSPGGLVADSHQIYHALKKLIEKKPVIVQMKRLAASGGYYVAMGAGPKAKIFAEPTTWTGSIGVIMPRYEFGELADKLGIRSAPLKTGEFKDTLNPFQPMSDSEKTLWMDILNQSYEQFVTIIDENRDTLDRDAVVKLATGQIYTARDAQKNGLIDEIGFEEDALKALETQLGGKSHRFVEYQHPVGLFDLLLGQAKAEESSNPLTQLLDASTPRAWFHSSGLTPALSR